MSLQHCRYCRDTSKINCGLLSLQRTEKRIRQICRFHWISKSYEPFSLPLTSGSDTGRALPQVAVIGSRSGARHANAFPLAKFLFYHYTTDTNVTDRHTDGRSDKTDGQTDTGRQQRLRLRIASRGKILFSSKAIFVFVLIDDENTDYFHLLNFKKNVFFPLDSCTKAK